MIRARKLRLYMLAVLSFVFLGLLLLFNAHSQYVGFDVSNYRGLADIVIILAFWGFMSTLTCAVFHESDAETPPQIAP